MRLADGRELPSDVTVRTAGFGVPGLAARSRLSTDAAGRLLTDETLTSVDDPRVLAAGDAAAPSGQALRMCCLNATPLGTRAADTVLSRIDGEEPGTVHQMFYAQCLSLGRADAVLQFANRSDVAVRAHVGGRLIARLKETICRSIPGSLSAEARKPGSFRLHQLPRGAAKRQKLLHASGPSAPATSDAAVNEATQRA